MVNIRKAKEGDIPAVAKIEKDNFSLPWSEDSFKSALNDEDTVFLTAEEKGDVIGFCMLHISFDEGEIYNIATDKIFRGRGIGDALLKEALKTGKERGVIFTFLEVRESNMPARKLYEKNGFENIGKRKNYYDEPKEDAVIYRLTTE